METPDERLKGLRLLVVEDDSLLLLDIEEMLSELGCEVVISAATVDTALDSIAQHSFDGALLDLNLHGKRITPAAEELAARGIPFVLCTGYGIEPHDEAVIRNAPRLTKPFNIESLRVIMVKAFSDVARR